MERRTRSSRAAELAARLRDAGARLVAVVEPIDDDRWRLVPEPGETKRKHALLQEKGP